MTEDERRCVRWGCPGPVGVLRCRECGGCCEWWNTPHLSAGQLAAIDDGTRFEADSGGTTCDAWEVTHRGPSKWGYPVTVFAVRPLGPAPDGVFEFQVERCGAVHYQYELKGTDHQGGSGGCQRFAVTGSAPKQAPLL